MRPVTISSKYRITIPREIRKQLGIKPGDKVAFIPYENSLEMVVVSPGESVPASPNETNLNGERKRKIQSIEKKSRDSLDIDKADR